jgi:hypothetical protein
MDIKVNYDKLNNKTEAYKAVKQAITPELLSKFQVKAEITHEEDLIKAKGKGFDLDLIFEEDHCGANLKLSFLLKPLKGKVLEGIEKQIKRIV